VIPTATLLTSCQDIESSANLLSNGGFEQISNNDARGVAPWTRSKTNEVYAVGYKPAAHCGTRYM
jgi:hypothetical protein